MDILKLWHGQYSLPVAFWGFLVGGSLFLFVMSVTIQVAFHLTPLLGLPLLIDLGVAWAYRIVACVGVWQSAAAYWSSAFWIDRFWAGVARALIVLLLGKMLLNFVGGGGTGLIQQIIY